MLGEDAVDISRGNRPRLTKRDRVCVQILYIVYLRISL